MDDSIFTKIINGDIPSHKIYEDEDTFAFLDISPITPGHTLVVPKKQVESLWDLDDDTYQKVMATAKKIAEYMRTRLNVQHVGVQVIGVDVAVSVLNALTWTMAWYGLAWQLELYFVINERYT